MIQKGKKEVLHSKMIKSSIYIILSFVLFIVSCNRQTVNNSVENLQMEENKVIKELFRLNSYETPNQSDFRKSCIKYIGIDIDTIKEDEFVIYGEYTMNKDNRYIKTFQESVFYQPEREKATQTIEETAQYLAKNITGKQILAFNQLLFRNDIAALSYFKKKENYSDAASVVLWFDYEESEILFENIIENYTFIEPVEVPEIQHLLFYNNPSNGYKRKVIDCFFQQSKNMNNIDFVSSNFQKMQNAFLNNYYQLEVPETIKDLCYIYIVEKLIEYDQETETEKSELTQFLGYSAIKNICFKYGLDFMDRLNKNNYYGSEIIQKYSNIYMQTKDIETPNMELNKDLFVLKARIEDKDGFTNMRKESLISSEIIGTVRDKDIVTVLSRENSDMWKIKSPEGLEGYIHKSRLNAYYQAK